MSLAIDAIYREKNRKGTQHNTTVQTLIRTK